MSDQTTPTSPLAGTTAFSGFSVKDFETARAFYADTLGVPVTVTDEQGGMFTIDLGNGASVFVYAVGTHQAGSFTVLNFQVPDVEAAVDALAARGVAFEHYEGAPQDEKGIARGMGPDIAWFKDPAGNVLSVIQA